MFRRRIDPNRPKPDLEAARRAVEEAERAKAEAERRYRETLDLANQLRAHGRQNHFAALIRDAYGGHP